MVISENYTALARLENFTIFAIPQETPLNQLILLFCYFQLSRNFLIYDNNYLDLINVLKILLNIIQRFYTNQTDTITIIINKTNIHIKNALTYDQKIDAINIYCAERLCNTFLKNVTVPYIPTIELTIKTLESNVICDLFEPSFIKTVQTIHFDFSNSSDQAIPPHLLDALRTFFKHLSNMHYSLLAFNITMPDYNETTKQFLHVISEQQSDFPCLQYINIYAIPHDIPSHLLIHALKYMRLSYNIVIHNPQDLILLEKIKNYCLHLKQESDNSVFFPYLTLESTVMLEKMLYNHTGNYKYALSFRKSIFPHYGEIWRDIEKGLCK